MIANQTVIAIIPARGGSKGVPDKNIKDLCGKPLIVWTIEAALKSSYIDVVLVTSDDDNILKISEEAGAKTIKRPYHLATDESTSIDTVLHALDNTKKHDIVILLQPTSPLRNEQHIDESLELFIGKGLDYSVVSVCEVIESPYWMYRVQGDKLYPLLEDIGATRRQDLPKVYKLNGAIYISGVRNLRDNCSFISSEVSPYIMSDKLSIDIDSLEDLVLVKKIIRRN